MPALLPGYEYDIFISYRQNDNRSGWVTEFVKALEEELSATIKLPVSVYFDSNPHDGLLETHNVDKSLENKLKCLIFIPILSQTYCDPSSFAWQHEFCAFNNKAKADPVGRDIILASGNVSSRILPIKIHDLDAEDKALFEREMGGVLRTVEFIFRSAGVNRPLRAHEEHPQDNLNKTFHRDQINKVANAIKEILSAMRNPETAKLAHNGRPKPSSTPGRRKVAMVVSLVGLLILSILWYMNYGNGSKPGADPGDTQNSIAVLPFVNMSQDPEQEYFSDGITEQIITNLAHINSLKVIARTSVMKFKKTEKSIAEIGKELNVTHVLEGSIRWSGDRVRVTAQLISSKDETHLWAQDYDRPLADIFTVQDEVSQAIARSLERRLTPREYETLKAERPSNVEAYQHYLKGYYIHFDLFYYKRLKEDFLRSETEFKAAIALDPAYALPYAGLADLYDTYRNLLARGLTERNRFEALRDSCIIIAMRLSPNDPYAIAVRAYSFYNKTGRTNADVDSAFKYMRRAFAIAPNNSAICDQLSTAYSAAGLYDQAIQIREKSISLDPTYGNYYAQLGFIYMQLGEFKKSEEALKKALLIEPEDVNALQTWVTLQLESGDLTEAEQAIQRIKDISPETDTRWSEANLFGLKGDKEKALSQGNQWFAYLALGMKKEALDRMESGFNYLHLKNSPVFNPLRQEPRFAAILEKTRLVYEERLRKYAN
jgi:TolB-like protein/Tfp pilus assembly protein PilF